MALEPSDTASPPSRKRRRVTLEGTNDATPITSSSPSKKPLAALPLIHRSKILAVQPGEWKKKSPQMPENIFQILKLLCSCQKGTRVISTGQWTKSLDNALRNHKLTAVAGTGTRATYGQSPSKRFMDDIIKESSRHEGFSANEAGWNCFVHAPLLKEALKLSTMEQFVQLHNVFKKSLAPMATRVDFAYALDTPQLDTGFENLHTIEGMLSYNHTFFEATLSLPICISIETKAHSGSGLRAQTQLGVWAISQHTKLAQLVALKSGRDAVQATTLPALPLLIGVGAEWYLLIASRKDSEHTDFFKCGRIGSTSSHEEILKLVATLQALIHWGSTTFNDWLMQHVVPEKPPSTVSAESP
ncbi:hypothetical protein FH972_024042 [Carpinus fangiana]|uniref:PD-(D/E)XK nuclease-like domain-containing protein n=1 Tax=Carpinus fangiana TaxID=176857 RepID=A0A5N6KZD4_9ROSI|nr:hypothetical protein FH972_024042 [Carpinus fangiana]